MSSGQAAGLSNRGRLVPCGAAALASAATASPAAPHLGGGDLQPRGRGALVGQSRAALALAIAVHATHGGRLLLPPRRATTCGRHGQKLMSALHAAQGCSGRDGGTHTSPPKPFQALPSLAGQPVPHLLND